MTITKRNMLGACAVALLLPMVGCSASTPTTPTALAAVIIIPVDPIGATTGDDSRLMAFAIDNQGTYTNVTTEASWTGARVQTSPQGFTSANLRGRGSVTVTYEGKSDVFTPSASPSSQPQPRLELVVTGSSQVSLDPHSSTNCLVLMHSATFFGIVTDRATLTSSDPGIAILEGQRIRPVAPGRVTITATYNDLTSRMIVGVLPAGTFR